MAIITLHPNEKIGKIKDVNAVGQPPFYGIDCSMFRYLTEAQVPYARLHDMTGIQAKGRIADIPNVFPDFDADPDDPDSYDFAFTDYYITKLVEAKVIPFYRLGVSIENYSEIKAYYIYPPKDFKKWAVVCEHVIRHYTEGWANGFQYPIQYWEIWNEPDGTTHTWLGTPEQFYEFYGTVSKHLKEKFPHLKIGGYAATGFYFIRDEKTGQPLREKILHFKTFFYGFMDYVKTNNCPLDFLSWHVYDELENVAQYVDFARKTLDGYGYSETESICTEWNIGHLLRGTSQHAALVASGLTLFQNHPLDSAMFYDARLHVSVYGSFFNPLTREPFPAYYAFRMFGELKKLGTEIKAECSDDRLYCLAASDGEKTALMIANPTVSRIALQFDPSCRFKTCTLIDPMHTNAPMPIPANIAGASVILLQE